MLARRIVQSIQVAPGAPPNNHAQWLAAEFESRFGVIVSPYTIEHWFTGAMRPDETASKLMAEILQVDTQWLTSGT